MELQTTDIIFPEWRDENSHRNYPFSDEATLSAAGGSTIPDDVFTDARLYPIGAGPDIYLRSIKIEDSTVTVTIADGTNPALASASFDYLAAPELLEFADKYGRPAGVLVSTAEQLRLLPALFTDTVTFTYAETAFATSTIIPQPQPGVRGILLDDGSFHAEDVYLIGVKGIVLTQVDSQTIRVDVVGDPYAQQKECAVEGIVVLPFCGLKTINHIGPDPKTGDFKISPGANAPYASDNILRVRFDAGELIIETMGAAGSAKKG